MEKALSVLIYLVVSSLVSSQGVGVNDDVQLDYPVSFSCPYVVDTDDVTDDSGDDDYYGTPVPGTYAGFIFFYAWMSFITVIPLVYFAINNRLAKVGVAKPFIPEIHHRSYSKKELDNSNCNQSGLKDSIIGRILHFCVVITLIGVQIVMLILVLCYYFILDAAQVRHDTPSLSTAWSPFDDGENSLYVFIIAWGVCFAWVLFFKRPQNLSSIFKRSCELADATTIAVFIPDSRGVELLIRDGMEWNVTRIFFSLYLGIDNVLACLFSEPYHKEPGQIAYCPVMTDAFGQRYFEFQMRRYNYSKEESIYLPAELHIAGQAKQLLTMKDGLSIDEVNRREAIIGPNVVHMEFLTLGGTILREFSRVFYVYQNFMTWSWFNYSYWHMGIVNTLVYVAGGLTVSIINFKNACRLQELCRVEGTVDVLRDHGKVIETIDQSKLVPGDVVVIRPGIVYCDMVLLSGEAVVDESSLTGESMPVVKTALDPTNDIEYDAELHHKHNTIYAGTTIVNQDSHFDDDEEGKKGDENEMVRRANSALVVKTGSFTMKGELLREMFYGKAKKFKFDLEVNIVLLILLSYAIFSFSMTIYFLNSQPTYGFFFAIYVVASALPPLLPTVFIVSEGISADRLLKKRIAVTDPHRILMAGKVRVAFFDKTGTLTEQGLDYHSVITSSKDMVFESNIKPPDSIARGMAVCHSLKKINQHGTTVLLGNAIDRKMFEATGYELVGGYGVNPDMILTSNEKFSILRQFDFDNKRKTQSVIVREESSGKIYIYVKGTSEAIKSISQQNTIPVNYDEIVAKSAKSGYYQISMGCRLVDDKDILTKTRQEVETNLSFIGFLNFTNRLKPQTPGVLQELRRGNIRSVMISGDHVLTAMFIARESGMIHPNSRILLGHTISDTGVISWVDEGTNQTTSEPSFDDLCAKKSNIELALVGSVWDALWERDKVQATKLAYFVRIIGRCSPHTKISIVDCFNREGFITMMCGDGGNDCGALKTAHVGVALSDAEASVVSSFTSLDKTITSVIDVLKEGRCTLASAFSSYKYMIMYGQIETINQMVCAYYGVTFSEWCWVFMDGFWVITMAFSLPFADVADTLAPIRPTSSILGPQTLASVLGVLLINFLFLVLALGVLNQQEFYSCRKWGVISIANVTAIGDNYESSVIFLVSGYQYITTAMAYNFGFKFRASWYKNWRFMFFIMAWTVVHFTTILYPSSLSCFFRVNCQNKDVIRGATVDELVPIQNPWHHTVMPLSFREILIIIVITNGVALAVWEYFFVNGFVADYIKSLFPKEDRLLGGIGYNGENEEKNSKPRSDILSPRSVGVIELAEVESSKAKVIDM